MSVLGYKAGNHPQQVAKNGARDDIDDRGTDPAYIAELEARPGWGPFDLDAAAAPHNHKAPRFFTRDDDGLSLPWDGNVWCNPPYSACAAWVKKAWDEWAAGRPQRIAMLLPANRCEQPWWQDMVEPYRDRVGSPLTVEFLRGRMRFARPAAAVDPRGDRPPFGCVLLVWSREGFR